MYKQIESAFVSLKHNACHLFLTFYKSDIGCVLGCVGSHDFTSIPQCVNLPSSKLPTSKVEFASADMNAHMTS